MKRIVKILLALLIASSLSACVKKNNQGKITYMYPAFKLENNKKKWGYINPEGDFVLEGKYDIVHDFSSEGLAKVEKNGLSGVINSNGEEILKAEYQTISDFSGGYFVAFNGDENQLFDYRGEIQFSGQGKYIHIGPYSDGLFTIEIIDENNQIKVGYIDESGSVVIEPEYSIAYDFIDGKAIVQENEKKFKIIDKNNELVKQLDYKEIRGSKISGIYLFRDEKDLYGLLDQNDDIIIKDEFASIEDMDEEYILVNISESDEKEYGIINKKGDYIIQPEYKDIKLLGQGYFALSHEIDEYGSILYKLVDNKGKSISDSKYYNVGGQDGKIKNDLISVYDGENTYAIDLKGKKSRDLLEFSGPGEVSFDGKVIKADISGKRSYYNKNKEPIWEETNDYSLKENAMVEEKKYLKERVIDIKYPVVSGLENKEAEDQINEKLYDEFLKSHNLEELNVEDYKAYKITYNVNRVNDLLVIQQLAELLGKEDTESTISAKIYNINLSNGSFYELKDLFKEDSAYLETLTDIIRGIAEQKNEKGTGMYDLLNWKGVQEDQDFIASIDSIDIYFKPSEILSFSEEFPKFRIKKEAIDDILDLNSEFWWAYSVNRGF